MKWLCRDIILWCLKDTRQNLAEHGKAGFQVKGRHVGRKRKGDSEGMLRGQANFTRQRSGGKSVEGRADYLLATELSEVPTELDGCELRDWQMVPPSSLMMFLPLLP